MAALTPTGIGTVAEVLGLALLLVGASFSGTELLAGIVGLVKFLTTVDDAKTEEDLKSCGKLFGDAVAKIGVNGLFFVLSLFGLKKASARLTAKTIADSNPVSGKWTWRSFKENLLKIGEVDNDKALIGEWIDVNENMSALSREYQKQITGQTGKAFIQNGVKFDGIKGNTLIDTKAHYSQFIDNKTGEFYTWFKGKQELLFQAKRQIRSSNGLKIEWYFAERETMDLVQDLFTENDINITLIYEPLK